MDYTPTHYHHHQNREIERMMSNSNANPSSTTRIEILDDGKYGGVHGGGGGNKPLEIIQREHMFDKVVTPSDVGKLNRLVIPKQHAEKYFPLDSSTNEKGLLLNFEDRVGKSWRFRYSYWNSSQSYVITKGWSRFVKEKKLDAGDIVSFQRGVGEIGKDKLFIDWRHRPDSHTRTFPGVPWVQGTSSFSNSNSTSSSPPFVLRSHPHLDSDPHPYAHPHPKPHHPYLNGRGGMWDMGWKGTGFNSGGGYGFGFGNVVNPYPYPVSGSLMFLRPSTSSTAISSGTQNNECNKGTLPSSSSKEDQNHQRGSPLMEREEGHRENGVVYESVPVVQGKAKAKRLRLFGVNMEVHQLNTSSFYNGSSSNVPHDS